MLLALPELGGRPIRITDRPRMAAHRGKLLAGSSRRGTPVHAAAFLRRREIVLETGLLLRPRLLRLILVHEIFHFVWLRLGNQRRAEFSAILAAERRGNARGELGESARAKKESLARGDALRNSRAWRDYICESFCDTAAWLYSGVRQDRVVRLAKRWRDARERWFHGTLEARCNC
jgi:hypothetical protein